MSDWCYDLELYPNVFTCTFRCTVTSDLRVYEISERRNDVELLRAFIFWLADCGHRGVGFNNCAYDYMILHYLCDDLQHVNDQQENINC